MTTSTKPTLEDLARLRKLYQAAVATLDQVRWAGGGCIYPEPINQFTLTLVGKPWGSFGYDPQRTYRTLANVPQASLEDLANLFTHIHRSERFCDGAWVGILTDKIPWDQVFARLEILLKPQIDFDTPRPPITHLLAIASIKQSQVWLFMTLTFVALALFVNYLRTHGHIATGNRPTPLWIIAAGMAITTAFWFFNGWRGLRELARIRRGEYLAHWTTSAPPTVSTDAIDERNQKTRLLFFLPLTVSIVGGLVLGCIGCYMKGDWNLVWKFGIGCGAIGLALGWLLAVPAWFLIGIRVRIASQLPSETIFTKSGFYQPGLFVPVMSWASARRDVVVSTPDRRCLTFKLHQHNPLQPELPKGTTSTFNVAIPPGAENEAEALAEYYRS